MSVTDEFVISRRHYVTLARVGRQSDNDVVRLSELEESADGWSGFCAGGRKTLGWHLEVDGSRLAFPREAKANQGWASNHDSRIGTGKGY